VKALLLRGVLLTVVFLTLEDETGFVNVVLWPTVFKRHLVLANTAVFLGVTGRVQAQEGVVHVIAERLWSPCVGSRPVHVRSRDFH